jgi:hypothetical protein
MATENPVEVVGELLGDMANRLGEYASIWQNAAKRNAENDYDVDDVVSDMLRASGLAARDMAKMGAAFIGVLGSVVTPVTEAAWAEAKPARAEAKPARKATTKPRAAKAKVKKPPTRRPVK